MDFMLFGIGHMLFFLVFAPLLSGIIKKSKALLQNRRGPRLLQPYYDLRKYFAKDMVISEHASWLFHVTPYAVFALIVAAALFVPTIGTTGPLAIYSDLFVIIYLLAAARFFLVLSSMDTASAFGGMGGSREMAISALVEPVLLLSLLSVSLCARSTTLSTIVEYGRQVGWTGTSFAHLFAVLGFMVVLLAETGRIPVDNPDTHLELTMVHEGMLLEYSGKYLALLSWAAAIKQLLLYNLLATVFFPGVLGWEAGGESILISVLVYIGKIICIGLLFAVIETSTNKMRLFRIPELIGASFVLSLLAIIAL
jgi:formate hydrogenlyase subunit 4